MGRYQPHDLMVDPARPRAEIWRTVCGLVAVALGYLTLVAVLFQFVAQTLPTGRFRGEPGVVGDTPAELLLVLFSFGCLTASVILVSDKLHQRPLSSLIGPFLPAFRDFFRVIGGILALYLALALLPPWGNGAEMPDLVPALPPGLWVMLLPLSLLAVFVQVSAEEIAFRGYLQSQLAARYASPVIWMGVPAVAFAAGHYIPAEAGGNATTVALWAGAFALLASDLTARTGTLGAATALHFVNNLGAILFVTFPGPLSGLALFHLPFAMDDRAAVSQMIPVDAMVLLCSWLAARVALRR